METDQSPSSSTTTLVPTDADVEAALQVAAVAAAAAAAAGHALNATTKNKPDQRLQHASIASTALQNTVGFLPQSVGREFVRQYYTVMSKIPQKLYRFYAANSTLTFNNNAAIVGQDKIRRDIEKRELRDCHTRILKIDAQPTLGNGLVVQVIGELSNNDAPLRPFTQTFVLTPLMPKNFFVHNEIFRFQDELQTDFSLESVRFDNSVATVSSTGCDDTMRVSTPELWIPPPVTTVSPVTISAQVSTAAQVLTQQVIVISKSIASIAIQTASESEWLTELNEDKAKTAEISTEHEKKTQSPKPATQSPVPVEMQKPLTVETNAIQSKTIKSKTTPQLKSDLLIVVEQEAPSKDSKIVTPIPATKPPMTYANVFKSSSGPTVKTTSEPLNELLNTEITSSYIPSATFTPSTSPNVLSPPATAKNEVPTLSRVTSPTPTPTPENRLLKTNNYREQRIENPGSALRQNVIPSASFQPQRRPRQPRDRYDDSLQLFLGNLPLNANVEALTRIFERYGTILELRVLSKAIQPGQRRLPNYGFLTYSTTEAVQRCLQDLPFYFLDGSRNNVRLNVRPKNTDETDSVHQSQSARSGRLNGRFDSGGDQIRNSDRFRYRRLLRRDNQEHKNGGGEAGNVMLNTPATTINEMSCDGAKSAPANKEEWPELGSISGGAGCQRKSCKK